MPAARRSPHSPDDDREEVRSLLVAFAVVGRCPAAASAEGCSGGAAGVLEQCGRRRALELRRLPSWRYAPDLPAPETGNDQVRPRLCSIRTAHISSNGFHGPKGWTVNEIPSTPDPSTAVHKRRLRFVPPPASPPPRSRRYPPPYPGIRAPLSLLRILAGPSLYAIPSP